MNKADFDIKDEQLKEIANKVPNVDKDRLRDLAMEMYLAAAGIAKLPTREMRRAATLALTWFYLDTGADARKKECGIFPQYEQGNKKKDEERQIIGWSIWTGYPYHHRIATDFSLRTTGTIDFMFGEEVVLSPDELDREGVRTVAEACPKCDGTGKWNNSEKDCFACRGTGQLDPENVIGVRVPLYILSVAVKCKEVGIPYTPIWKTALVSVDNDTAWKSGTLLGKAIKRAKVACLREYCPVRSKDDYVIISDEPDDPSFSIENFNPDAVTEEILKPRPAATLPEPEVSLDDAQLEALKEQKEGVVISG